MAIATGRRCLVEAQFIPAVVTQLYAASDVDNKRYRVSIDECTLAPPTGATATATLYILPKGTSVPAAQHVVLAAKSRASTDPVYLCPEIIGHILEPGDSIWGLGSAATLGIRICGELMPA